ncbi:MAG TPA: YdcF family protein [Candidatus Saccharimonadales bacterium]
MIVRKKRSSPMLALEGQPDSRLLQIIWSFLGFRTKLEKADAIIACGSRDLHVAKEAAKLYKRGLAPWLVTTGGYHTKLEAVEAGAYAEVAIKMGVPGNRIIKEPNARNLGDNVQFSMQILEQLGIKTRKVILVHTPIATLRTYATFLQQCPTSSTRYFCAS